MGNSSLSEPSRATPLFYFRFNYFGSDLRSEEKYALAIMRCITIIKLTSPATFVGRTVSKSIKPNITLTHNNIHIRLRRIFTCSAGPDLIVTITPHWTSTGNGNSGPVGPVILQVIGVTVVLHPRPSMVIGIEGQSPAAPK